ncbi:MAG: UbiD family decarboxylase [Planctomycetaceae bacterium]|nr:UbiD family decarboxylase [Planctomycetaceae bacterium]
MAYRCLTDFLEDLAHADQLRRVADPVEPTLQLAAEATQSAWAGGPALLFGDVRGHDMPVLCNLLATESRLLRALGVESLDALAQRIAQFADRPTSQGWLERLAGGAGMLDDFAPRKVKSAAVQQIVRLGGDVELGELPLLQSLPEETGRAIAGAVVAVEPDSRRPSIGRFELEGIDRARLAVGWAPFDDHARLLDDYRQRGQPMPLAVVLGGDPAMLAAQFAPLPSGGDLWSAAGLLREKPLDVVACRGLELDVAAEAEMILEGFVDPQEPLTTMGPRCSPMGLPTRPRPAPVMHVTAVTHRANPVCVATIAGRPPHEAVVLRRAMQRAFLPLARWAMPELIDYDLPEAAAARFSAVVSIRKTHAGQGRRAASMAWGLPALRFAKTLVVVDADVDVRDAAQVTAAVASHVRPDRDLLIDVGPADPCDPTAPPDGVAAKMAMDATRKWSME